MNIAKMAKVFEQQMQGTKVVLVGAGNRGGKTLAMEIALASIRRKQPEVIITEVGYKQQSESKV